MDPGKLKVKAKRKDNNKEVIGYFWKSPKSEHGKSFIIETYISCPPTSTKNALLSTRSIEIIEESVERL